MINAYRVLVGNLKEGESVVWIHLARDRDQCRAVVNTIMKLRALLKAGNFLTV